MEVYDTNKQVCIDRNYSFGKYRAGSLHSGTVAERIWRAVIMWKKGGASFDPKIFLARVGDGKTISKNQKGQIVFSQGDVADAVF
jgi:hypothetical protein